MQRRGRTAVFLGMVLCGACGSGGGGGSAPPEESMAQKATFDAFDADHLLQRTQFGVTGAARTAIEQIGLPAYVDAMLQPPALGSSAVETAAAARLVNVTDPPGYEGKFPSQNDVTEWWLEIMMRTQTPFRERLALFLHDHFAVSTDVLSTQERHWMVDHIDLLRGQGLGNFRDLVLAIARDPAMLEWLDGDDSVKGEPNENFAREFLELFTVGADNGYTEEDIREASRAFTGYQNKLDGATNLRYMEFVADRKDTFAKVVFGEVLRSTGDTEDDYGVMVDLTFATLDVASWLAEKLLLEFVTDTPNAAQIAALARVVRQHDYEMRPILRALFLSQAFYAARGSMVRSPVDFGIGFVRSTGLTVDAATMRSELAAVAQEPSRPPSVFGWPQGSEWLSADGMVERANLARRVIGDRTYQTNNGFVVAMPAGTPDAAAVVDHFAGLLGVTLTTEERDRLITYLDSRVTSGPTVQADTFDCTNAQDVDERVRGLLYILANHPGCLAR
ncbi:MAG: DUF1800 domain-containing protein [Planctomycetes bacterium]|nr:DUF1800 domain-containing protein [Planctomycetota bacterium]